MLLPVSWLKAQYNIDIPVDVLENRLTMAGLEVEEVRTLAPFFSQVVVGEVKSVAAHTQADKLKIVRVDVGQADCLQIVCGAKNVVEGMRVPVAQVGAVLPEGLEIKAANLRGVDSSGMLCSAKELGLAESSEGLLALPADAPIGVNVRQYLGLDEKIIDIGLTPNRADCFSMRGLAREIGALFNKTVKQRDYHSVAVECDATIQIENQSIEACPRYMARRIVGLDNRSKTPDYIANYLQQMGVRLHDAVVDITNFVMLELGTPLHAFDGEKLSGGIVVRFANSGERLHLIDGQEALLTENTLVIADKENPLAIAGVMGGRDSACSVSTTEIVLESAWFNPVVIAGKARAFGLSSDSAQRFERGVDFTLQRHALEWASELIIAVCGGQAGEINEVCDAQYLPHRLPIQLEESAIEKRLGRSYPASQVSDIFARLMCEANYADAVWTVTPPAWRFDLSITEDLIEEIARIDGYENIVEKSPKLTISKEINAPLSPVARLRERLLREGMNEVITYSFIDRAAHQAFFADAPVVCLQNPISRQMAEMRLSLLPALVQTAVYNLNRQHSDLAFFEIGRVFLPQGDTAIETDQPMRFALLLHGRRQPESWSNQDEWLDFYDLKGIVERVFAGLTQGLLFRRPEKAYAYLHSGQSAEIVVADKVVGVLGALHPEVSKQMGVKGKTLWVVECEVCALPVASVPRFEKFSKYPSVRRDIAIVLDKQHEAQTVLDFCRQQLGEVCVDAFCFDQFSAESLGEGNKSLALGFILQSFEKTLQDEEVASMIAALFESLKCQFGAEIRM